MSRWSPPLRIARRTVRKSLGRSLLIAVLVGLPVAGATFVDVLIHSFDNPERSAYLQMGPADADLTVTPEESLDDFAPIAYDGYHPARPQRDRDPSSVDLAAVLPEGSTWTQKPLLYELRLSLPQDRIIRPELVVADLGSPLTAHQARRVAGELPTDDSVAVTKPLAERLDLLDDNGQLVDGSVTVENGPTATVTAIVQSPLCLDCERVVTSPGSTIGQAFAGKHRYTGVPAHTYLVDLPESSDASALWPMLADQGIALTPRDAYLHPERYGNVQGGGISIASAADLKAAALALLVTGLGLLEVVLLAGTAFAVGARRQVHDLGVISASGAASRQIRRIVLAQGLVLGLLGSALGIAFGATAAVGGRRLWEHLDNGIVLGWSFGLWEIVAAAVVGAVSGVLAAVVPAFGAGRMTAVDALSGRFRITAASNRRTPIIGGALVTVGIATGIVGDRMMAADFAAYVDKLARAKETGSYVSSPQPTVPVGLVLLGAVFAVVGMVVLAPVIITSLGRLARRLPLSGRLAIRDAARHRHRTGPATSAIAVAVAGSVVFAFVLAGRAEADRLSYHPYLPPDVMSISGRGFSSGDGIPAAADQAATHLPDASVTATHLVTRRPGARHPESGEIYVNPVGHGCSGGCNSLLMAEVDPRLMALAMGREPTDDELATIADGKALVLSSRFVDSSGRARLEGSGGQRLEAVAADVPQVFSGLPGVFVSPRVIDDHGWAAFEAESLVAFSGSATKDQVDDAKTAVEEQGVYASLDTGPSDPSRILLLIAGIAAAFVTLVGVAISVALSAAEGKADLATLAAVGAPPRRRRTLAAAQAVLVGGLGCALGLGLGVFVSYTLRATIGAPGFVVPWNNLIAVGVVVPLVAMLVAAVFTPSRLPLTVRRSW